MGHSRGGHIAFRVAEQRPDLLRRLVLAEPGGDLDAIAQSRRCSLRPLAAGGADVRRRRRKSAAAISTARCRLFFDMIDGDGAWKRLPAAAKQQLRDNAFTLIGQVDENRKPFARSEAESIRTPTLLIGGGDTKGSLAPIWRVLAQHIPGARTAVIPGARHWIFDQAPQEFSDTVMEFLAA